jgi:hypothetical protein
MIIALSILVNKFLMKSIVGWTMLSIWILALVAVGMSAVNISGMFKEKGVVKITNTAFIEPDKTIVIDIQSVNKPVFSDSNFIFNVDNTNFKIVESKDSLVKITQKFTARGKNIEDAEENAKLLNHSYSFSDSVITLGSRAIFGEKAIYRGQSLVVEIAIPIGRKVFFDDNFYRVNADANVQGEDDEDDLPGNLFMMETDGLNCMTCDNNSNFKVAGIRVRTSTSDDDEQSGDVSEKNYKVGKFAQISASTPLNIKVIPSEKYEVIAFGDEEDLKKLKVSTEDGVLKIGRNKYNWGGTQNEIKIEIRMPKIEKIALAGATTLKTDYFDTENSIELDVIGASTLKLNGKFRKVKANIVGASRLTIIGETENFKADVVGASVLDASDLNAEKINVECSGASTSKLNCETADCNLEANGGSSISYKGESQKIKNDISSSISKND